MFEYIEHIESVPKGTSQSPSPHSVTESMVKSDAQTVVENLVSVNPFHRRFTENRYQNLKILTIIANGVSDFQVRGYYELYQYLLNTTLSLDQNVTGSLFSRNVVEAKQSRFV